MLRLSVDQSNDGETSTFEHTCTISQVFVCARNAQELQDKVQAWQAKGLNVQVCHRNIICEDSTQLCTRVSHIGMSSRCLGA